MILRYPRYKCAAIALTLLRIALYERISFETGETHAHRRMTYHTTIRINTAGARTRIATLLIDARQVRGAFAVTDAFRPAIRRFADELRQAGA